MSNFGMFSQGDTTKRMPDEVADVALAFMEGARKNGWTRSPAYQAVIVERGTGFAGGRWLLYVVGGLEAWFTRGRWYLGPERPYPNTSKVTGEEKSQTQMQTLAAGWWRRKHVKAFKETYGVA